MKKRERIPSATKNGSVAVSERLKVFNEKQFFAVLATNDNSQPYTSLISFAMTPDLTKVIFATPKETRKYKNIVNSKRVAILIDNRSNTRKNLMEMEAITIIGDARLVRRGKTRDEFASLFLTKHPELYEFIQSVTTALIVVDAIKCIHVGEFQTISVWDCWDKERSLS